MGAAPGRASDEDPPVRGSERAARAGGDRQQDRVPGRGDADGRASLHQRTGARPSSPQREPLPQDPVRHPQGDTQWRADLWDLLNEDCRQASEARTREEDRIRDETNFGPDREGRNSSPTGGVPKRVQGYERVGDKQYVIFTEDGEPATKRAQIAAEEREYELWETKAQQALTAKERAAEEERARICIWCGLLCDSIEALEAHEEDCE